MHVAPSSQSAVDTAGNVSWTHKQLLLRERPRGWPAGYQQWSDLLFVHWRVPADELAACLPPGVEVDTWRGEAWLGVVAFAMSGVRPWWFPALPWLSAFPETNLRTYVRCGGEPGVYFFSLEASQRLAVAIARRRWQLPYWLARMELNREGPRRVYRSQRVTPQTAKPGRGVAEAAISHLECAVGDPLPAPQPGSLEFFLVERYLLFVQRASGWWRGHVHHPPYALREARLTTCEQSLAAAAGLHTVPWPDHVVYSPGVRVEVFPLRRVESTTK